MHCCTARLYYFNRLFLLPGDLNDHSFGDNKIDVGNFVIFDAKPLDEGHRVNSQRFIHNLKIKRNFIISEFSYKWTSRFSQRKQRICCIKATFKYVAFKQHLGECFWPDQDMEVTGRRCSRDGGCRRSERSRRSPPGRAAPEHPDFWPESSWPKTFLNKK